MAGSIHNPTLQQGFEGQGFSDGRQAAHDGIELSGMLVGCNYNEQCAHKMCMNLCSPLTFASCKSCAVDVDDFVAAGSLQEFDVMQRAALGGQNRGKPTKTP